MIVNCESASPDQPTKGVITKRDIFDWFMSLPEDARLEPVIKDFGNQRDPYERLIGLVAKWTEIK